MITARTVSNNTMVDNIFENCLDPWGRKDRGRQNRAKIKKPIDKVKTKG